MTSMTLRDMVPVSKTVKIVQGNLTIRPLSLREFSTCLFKNPHVMGLLDGKEVVVRELLKEGPEFVTEAIILACGGDPDQDARFVDMIIPGDQIKIIQALIKESFPDGFQDFFSRPSAPSSASTSAATNTGSAADVVKGNPNEDAEALLSA